MKFKNPVSVVSPVDGEHATNKDYVDGLCGGQLPIGAIVPFSGSVIPYGYLLCDGQEISRAKYSTLFSVIGEIFGSGDGSTTFNVPDLRDKFPQGASGSNPVGTVKEAGLPNITGDHTTYDYGNDNATTGAFTKRVHNPNSSVNIIVGSEAPYTKFSFNASRSSSIYGKSNTVQPPSVCVNYIIRAKVVDTTNLTGEAKESYSTEEQVIGTWIDGKPLYRRVINSTTPNVERDTELANKNMYITEYNVETMVTLQGIANISGVFAYSGQTFNDYSFYLNYNANEKFISVSLNRLIWANQPLIVILEYTKTTD